MNTQTSKLIVKLDCLENFDSIQLYALECNTSHSPTLSHSNNTKRLQILEEYSVFLQSLVS